MVKEPASHRQACQSLEWVEAMNKELDALSQNQTWILTNLPEGKKPIGCKWVYKVKLNHNGTVESYKASLVAKGFN